MVVSAVASVHEEVEERTSQNYQPQPPEQMGPMLGNQVKGADGQEPP